MKRLFLAAWVVGSVGACSASGSSGTFYTDGGLDSDIEEPVEDGGADAMKKDAGKDSSTTGTGPLVIKNLSYGGSTINNMDVSFSLTGSTQVDRVTSIEFQFDGEFDKATLTVTCTYDPWNIASTGVESIVFTYYSGSQYSVQYPCAGAQTTGYAQKTSSGFGAAFGSDLTVTFKGLMTDATPFSIPIKGSKR